MKKNTLFTAFIAIYFLFLAHHAIHELSLIMFVGLGLAFYSHTRKGPLTPSLLLLHMGVEWVEWLHSPVAFVTWLARLGHSGMDITFYHHEVMAHKRSKIWLWGGASFIVIIVFASLFIEIPKTILEPLHQFSIGGTVGCVGSHIWFHIFHEPRGKT